MTSSDVTVGGSRVTLLSEERLRQEILDALGGAGQLVIGSANLDHVWWFGRRGAHADPPALRGAGRWLVTADGVPVVRAARVLTRRKWPQLAGADLLPVILRLARDVGASVGFVGGFPDQHARIADALTRDLPGLQVAGYWAPARDDLEDPVRAAALATAVAAAEVELLVVGLGKPRQELWLAEHVAETGASVALAFGAAADFLAGTVTRAPERWRRYELEWLYRLLQEPRRLWRRYLFEGPVALWRVLRWSSRAS